MEEENIFEILFRWMSGALLCFFGFIPTWIFGNVIITLVNEPSKFDWGAVLALSVSAAGIYFFAILAYRAFTGRGRKQDGGLLPPWAMLGFVHSFGVIAVLCIFFGVYQKEWRPILGGLIYLVIAYRSLVTFKRKDSIESKDV